MNQEEAKQFYFLLTFATNSDIKILKRRWSFHRNVNILKETCKRRGIHLQDISIHLGLHPKSLAANLSPSSTKHGRYNFGMLIKALEYMDIPIDPILMRHKERRTN